MITSHLKIKLFSSDLNEFISVDSHLWIMNPSIVLILTRVTISRFFLFIDLSSWKQHRAGNWTRWCSSRNPSSRRRLALPFLMTAAWRRGRGESDGLMLREWCLRCDSRQLQCSISEVRNVVSLFMGQFIWHARRQIVSVKSWSRGSIVDVKNYRRPTFVETMSVTE